MGTLDLAQAAIVAEGVYALDEPWRSRFVQLIAKYVDAPTPDGLPAKSDVMVWLSDESVYDIIRQMLRTWTHAA